MKGDANSGHCSKCGKVKPIGELKPTGEIPNLACRECRGLA